MSVFQASRAGWGTQGKMKERAADREGKEEQLREALASPGSSLVRLSSAFLPCLPESTCPVHIENGALGSTSPCCKAHDLANSTCGQKGIFTSKPFSLSSRFLLSPALVNI